MWPFPILGLEAFLKDPPQLTFLSLLLCRGQEALLASLFLHLVLPIFTVTKYSTPVLSCEEAIALLISTREYPVSDRLREEGTKHNPFSRNSFTKTQLLPPLPLIKSQWQ